MEVISLSIKRICTLVTQELPLVHLLVMLLWETADFVLMGILQCVIVVQSEIYWMLLGNLGLKFGQN